MLSPNSTKGFHHNPISSSSLRNMIMNSTHRTTTLTTITMLLPHKINWVKQRNWSKPWPKCQTNCPDTLKSTLKIVSQMRQNKLLIAHSCHLNHQLNNQDLLDQPTWNHQPLELKSPKNNYLQSKEEPRHRVESLAAPSEPYQMQAATFWIVKIIRDPKTSWKITKLPNKGWGQLMLPNKILNINHTVRCPPIWINTKSRRRIKSDKEQLMQNKQKCLLEPDWCLKKNASKHWMIWGRPNGKQRLR